MKRMFKQMDQTPKKKTKRVKLTEQIDELESKTQNNPQNGHKQGENQRVQNTEIKNRLNIHHLRYLLFLMQYKQDLEKDFTSQKMKWYEKMSDFIGGTTAQNCGIFHKGQLQKFQNVDQIISHFKEIVIFNRQEMINQYERIRSIIQEYEKDQQDDIKEVFNKKNLNNEKIQIVKFQLLSHIKLTDNQLTDNNSREKIFCCDIKNEIPMMVQIPIQVIMVIQKEKNFQDNNLLIQKQKKDIQQFKKRSQNKKALKNKIRRRIQRVYKRKIRIKQLLMKNENMMINENVHLQKDQVQRQRQMNQRNQREQNINKLFYKKYINNLFYKKYINIQDPKQKYINSPEQKQPTQQNVLNMSNIDHLKLKRTVYWSKAQCIKMMVYLNIIKDDIGTRQKNTKFNINMKCSKYINTNKTKKNCQKRIRRLLKKYLGDFSIMISQETKRLKIPQDLFKKEKQNYFYQNPYKIQIELQFPTITYKLQQPDLQKMNINQIVHSNLRLNPSLKIEMNLCHPKNCFKEDLQMSNKQNLKQRTVQHTIKSELHIKASQRIFETIKSFYDGEINKRIKNTLTIKINKNVQMIFN